MFQNLLETFLAHRFGGCLRVTSLPCSVATPFPFSNFPIAPLFISLSLSLSLQLKVHASLSYPLTLDYRASDGSDSQVFEPGGSSLHLLQFDAVPATISGFQVVPLILGHHFQRRRLRQGRPHHRRLLRHRRGEPDILWVF